MTPSSHLILCYPLLLLPPIPLSIRVFSNEPTLLMRWPKYWSFSLTSFLPKKDLIIQCTKTWGVLSMRSTTEHLSHLTYKLINKPQFLLKYKRPIFGHPMNYGIWILLSLSAVTLVISRSSSIPLDSKVILKQRVKKAKCKIT